jgi:hypothetical protein
MRILANFGYKNNGDSYSVTFETVGDVPKDKADATVDELFRMARQAIERQVSPEAGHEDIAAVEDATGQGQGKKAKGNGSGPFSTGSKPRIKEPNAPATKKQKGLIMRLAPLEIENDTYALFLTGLAREKDQFVDGIEAFTMQEASTVIDQLMAC